MAVETNVRSFWRLFALILAPERGYAWLTVIYGIAYSVLTLAVPLCVQVLIGSVANTAVAQPIIVLSTVLLVLLACSALLIALQIYVMELFQRRVFARLTADIVLRNINARYAYLETINREELVNRYFEIMTVQKNVPSLLIGGLALLLQTVVGLVLTSLYHPVFLLFNILIVALVYGVIRVLLRPAVFSAVALSDEKYRMARWLEELARANNYFKGTRSVRHALDVSDRLARAYVDEHRRHFGFRFSQIIGLLLVYALGSAALLGLGGWLVINNELTLGQLVAAELVLSGIFAGFARFGDYLDLYYELHAALVKLGYFRELPLEELSGDLEPAPGAARLELDAVQAQEGRDAVHFSLDLPAGATALVAGESNRVQHALLALLQRHAEAARGRILLGGQNLADCQPMALRDRVVVLDSSGVLERSIAEYLSLGDPSVSRADMRDALEAVALDEVIEGLPRKLDTPLGVFGYPLSRSETLRLKLAAALLAEPALVLVNEVFDAVSARHRHHILEYLRKHRRVTLLYFSNRRDVALFDTFLYLRQEGTLSFASLDELNRFEETLVTGLDSVPAVVPRRIESVD